MRSPAFPGAKLIPLGQISQRADTELDPDEDIVLQCKGGVRSAQALAELQAKGYKHLTNLKGGILAWSDDVDPSVPKY
jgi:adenylyltransferase/sulfurtransferase